MTRDELDLFETFEDFALRQIGLKRCKDEEGAHPLWLAALGDGGDTRSLPAKAAALSPAQPQAPENRTALEATAGPTLQQQSQAEHPSTATLQAPTAAPDSALRAPTGNYNTATFRSCQEFERARRARRWDRGIMGWRENEAMLWATAWRPPACRERADRRGPRPPSPRGARRGSRREERGRGEEPLTGSWKRTRLIAQAEDDDAT